LSLFTGAAFAQDASTGTIRGTVSDRQGARIVGASISLKNETLGWVHVAITRDEGEFVFHNVPPGTYAISAAHEKYSTGPWRSIALNVGAELELNFELEVEGKPETTAVTETPSVEIQPGVSDVIDRTALDGLPLNGRRYTDLMLLTPGVTTDPRGLTAGSNGDLSYGGLRGFQTSYLVDGLDNNNTFFAQARGRYRAPFQFSEESIDEFRVLSNTFGAEQGRGNAVVNVVTRTGSNHTHGSVFYHLRDGKISGVNAFVRKKYPDMQHQFGFTLGGPLRKEKLFYFVSFDQHIFHVPNVVQFLNGSSTLVPQPADYEASDQALVFASAAQLNTIAGDFRSALIGDAGFARVDYAISLQHQLATRINVSRFWGSNNVFFDPGSPITNFSTSNNGKESVATESANTSLTSAWSQRWSSQVRLQFSHDLQASQPNNTNPLTKILGIINGLGRSVILPRNTNQLQTQAAGHMTRELQKHSVKFGGDMVFTKTANFFPGTFGGEYIFDPIRVNPFTFAPETFGLSITPLRAYAHRVPRYFFQDFGNAASHPNTNEYALFVEDSWRVHRRLNLNFGVRYDLQTFRSDLQSNSLWTPAGKVPSDRNNFAPRFGFGAALGGENRPWMIRGGAGIFFTRIPQIYNSSVETQNGASNGEVFLDNRNFFAQQVFPVYPNPLAVCPVAAAVCSVPVNASGFLSSTVFNFAPDFQTPYVEQASVSVEKEVLKNTTVTVSGIYVAGKHLIRARDVNLPTPQTLTYPLLDETGTTFTGQTLSVQSFANWQFVATATCPFPPCINSVQRPVSKLGAIYQYESVAASIYEGLTVSVKRRMSRGLYVHSTYTWANATDTLQDALVAGSTSNVQNSAAPNDKGRSTAAQRHRLSLAVNWLPMPFAKKEHGALAKSLNNWQLAGVVTAGSGRPVNAVVTGDANRDGNTSNDRLPGVSRNSINSPMYFTVDSRISRQFKINKQIKLEAMMDVFNTFNHLNPLYTVTESGYITVAASFVPIPVTINGVIYPGYYSKNANYLKPQNAYAPRQIQFAVKLRF